MPTIIAPKIKTNHKAYILPCATTIMLAIKTIIKAISKITAHISIYFKFFLFFFLVIYNVK